MSRAKTHEVSRTTKGSAPSRLLIAGGVGTFLEWYDYALFGFMAPQIAAAFFPGSDATTSLLNTLAVLGVSFVARPFGGAYFGHLGDKLGRRGVLALVVGMMTVGTVGIGLTPTVAQIGIAAPIILVVFRLLQGFSAGGEYSGASAFLIEHASRTRKGFYASIIIAAVGLSAAVGSGTSIVIQALTSTAEFEAWGWRIPFIASAVIGAIGLYIRFALDETSAFKELRHEEQTLKMPLVEAFRSYGRVIWVLVWVATINGLNIYILNAYIPNYLQSVVKLDGGTALAIAGFGQIVFTVSAIAFGFLYNKNITAPVFLIGALGFVILPLPAFALMNTAIVPLGLLGCGIWGLVQGVVNVGLTLLQVELLPTNVRFSGSAIAYGIAYLVFAGTVAYVATFLVDLTGSYLAAPVYTVSVTSLAIVILLVWRLLDKERTPRYL